MKTIVLAPTTYQMIRNEAGPNFRSTATKRADGNWDVPIEDDVYEHVMALRSPGETIDDCLQRAIHVARGSKPN